ncbi:MAG: BrnT family toxin [Sedimentisphaerales bacterium]|nr:BrnT family toxin [Sedimentisphaerales bacterium]
MIEFEWDPEKAKANRSRHRISFGEAATALRDPLGITVFDPDHSQDEDRYLTVGMSDRGRAMIVAHTDRGDRIRIISARELTRTEREHYEEEIRRRQER